MSWLPHTIFHCHERQDSITRDAQGMKKVCFCVCVCKTNVQPLSLHQAVIGLPEILRAFSARECINLRVFIKWNNSSLVHFGEEYMRRRQCICGEERRVIDSAV